MTSHPSHHPRATGTRGGHHRSCRHSRWSPPNLPMNPAVTSHRGDCRALHGRLSPPSAIAVAGLVVPVQYYSLRTRAIDSVYTSAQEFDSNTRTPGNLPTSWRRLGCSDNQRSALVIFHSYPHYPLPTPHSEPNQHYPSWRI